MTIATCKNHPSRETGLRCKLCDEPICPDCAVRTPTGYSCPQCEKGHRKKFDTAQPQDYLFAFIVAAVLSYLGSLIVSFVGFFVFFIAPSVGIGIAEVVRRVVSKRRSRALFITAAVGVIIGVLPMVWPYLFALLFGNFGALAGLLWPGIYLLLAVPTTYARLSGIQIR